MGQNDFSCTSFGHMHTDSYEEVAQGWDKPRECCKAHPYSAREKFGNPPKEERVIGYSAGLLTRRGAGFRFCAWPRVAVKIQVRADSSLTVLAAMAYRSDNTDATEWRNIFGHDSLEGSDSRPRFYRHCG